MPIIDLQRRLTEVGRIRMGATVATSGGKTRPVRLEQWRLTSRDDKRLQAVAEHYGGAVTPWEGHDGEFFVDTTTDELPIMLLPGQTMSQWMEMWSGGGCQRRCDGQTEHISGGDCLCPSEYTERADAAKDGKACKPTTRLAVLLPEIPGIGCWRLETHGYYAAVELAGVTQLLEEATRRGALLPARLRIDQRHDVKNGQTRKYPVPVVDIDVRLPEMLSAANAAVVGELPRPITTEEYELAKQRIIEEFDKPRHVTVLPPGPSIREALEQTATRTEPSPRSNAQEPIGEIGIGFDTTPIPVDGDPVEAPVEPQEAEYASHAQRRRLWAIIRERGIPDDKVRQALTDVTGQESTAKIPKNLYETVVTAIQGLEP